MTNKSALELFREGLDYQQISLALKITVPDVERKIHSLRSNEKGDTSQQDYRDHLRLKDEHRIELKRRRVRTMSCRREPLAYVGKEER